MLLLLVPQTLELHTAPYRRVAASFEHRFQSFVRSQLCFSSLPNYYEHNRKVIKLPYSLIVLHLSKTASYEYFTGNIFRTADKEQSRAASAPPSLSVLSATANSSSQLLHCADPHGRFRRSVDFQTSIPRLSRPSRQAHLLFRRPSRATSSLDLIKQVRRRDFRLPQSVGPILLWAPRFSHLSRNQRQRALYAVA